MGTRIAVTGIGVVSNAGVGIAPFWKSLLDGVPDNSFLLRTLTHSHFLTEMLKRPEGLTGFNNLLLQHLMRLLLRLAISSLTRN